MSSEFLSFAIYHQWVNKLSNQEIIVDCKFLLAANKNPNTNTNNNCPRRLSVCDLEKDHLTKLQQKPQQTTQKQQYLTVDYNPKESGVRFNTQNKSNSASKLSFDGVTTIPIVLCGFLQSDMFDSNYSLPRSSAGESNDDIDRTPDNGSCAGTPEPQDNRKTIFINENGQYSYESAYKICSTILLQKFPTF